MLIRDFLIEWFEYKQVIEISEVLGEDTSELKSRLEENLCLREFFEQGEDQKQQFFQYLFVLAL